MSASNFLLIITLFLFIMALLKSKLKTDKAIRMNTYYHVYKNQQMLDDYDFFELLEKERKYYPIGTGISLGAYLLTIFIKNETINNLLVLVVISVLGFSIIYLRPQKKN